MAGQLVPQDFNFANPGVSAQFGALPYSPGAPSSGTNIMDAILPPTSVEDFQFNFSPTANAGGGFTGVPGVTGGGGIDWQSLLLGGKDSSGALNLGTQLLSGLAQYGLMSDQLDLAEDQFGFQKDFANRNLQNQAKTVNTALSDRQNARIGSVGDPNISGTGYESLASYMDKNQLSTAPIGSGGVRN